MWKRILIIAIILPTVGCLLGYVIADIQYGQHNVTWELLGTPPSAAVRMIQSSRGIVISTRNGQIYKYVSYNEWKLLDEEPSETWVEDFSELCKDVTAPLLEGTIDSKEHCARYEMGSAYRKFAIVEDGSVWMWHKTIKMHGFDYVFFMLTGSFGFLVLGLITTAVMRLLNQKKDRINVDT